MKKTICLFVMTFLAITLYAQVEVYTRINTDRTIEPDLNIYGTKKISSKMKFTYFALLEENWSEGLLGCEYSPTSWISLGLSTGIEHNPTIYRFAGSLWIGKGKMSLLSLCEKGDGSDNYWYKTVAGYKHSDMWTIGAVAWRYHGVGPIVKYTPKKSDLTLWVMPAYDTESRTKRAIVGLSLKIQD